MSQEQNNRRGQEIEQRLEAIAAEANRANITDEEMTALEAETEALQTEQRTLLELNRRRTALNSSIAEGRTGDGASIISRLSGRDRAGEEMEADPYGSVEYRRAFMNHVVRGTAMPKEYRAGEITHTTDVGSVIPTPVLNRIIEEMESTGMILPLVTRTAHKGGLRIPTSSVKPVASWVAEGAGSPTQKKPTGEISFLYHKLRCAVAVTLEVDTMAIPAFETALVNNVVEAMVKGVEDSIINGTGTGQPKGILKEAPQKEQIIQVQTPSYKDLIDAEAALDVAYEANTVYCMTKKTFMEYFGVLDDNKQPIGRVNFGITNRPERTLLGRTVVLCDYLPSFGAELPKGTPFAFMFNFRDYVLNTNLNMGIKRYEDNETDDIVTRAVMLVDGKVVAPQSLVLLVKKS